MRRNQYPLAAFAFILAACSLAGIAAQAGGPRCALVIGNGNYSELGRLKNPANDATDMGQALTELGFKVRLFVDADLPSMEDAVVRLGSDLAGSADSVGFFFYAGHGVQAGGTNYLIPADARIASEAFLKNKALPAQSVLDTLQGARNALNIVVLDACRDNPFSWGRSTARGLTVVGSQPTGSIVAYATSAGSVAQDGTGRNGVFTSELLKQIRTPGLEIKDVFNRTGKGVSTVTAGKQVPAVYNQFFDSAYLAGAQGAAAASPAQVATAPAVAATMTVTRSYGSLVVSSLSAGTLYLDGKFMGDLPAGAEARLDNNVEVGERSVELRYASGDKESQNVTVRKGQSSVVSFSWKKAAPQTPVAPAQPAVVDGMVLVPSGSFTMGSRAGEAGRYGNEVQHQVSVGAFYIGATEVTQAQYKAVMGDNPSNFKGDDLPVESVSWHDAVAFCNKLSEREGLSTVYTINGNNVTAELNTKGYRLPTEAEWEYAAKGCGASGSLAVNAVYAGSANLADVAWYSGNSGYRTHPVGQKKANALGLYDMAGNVWEWCWDIYGNYPSGSQRDPMGAPSGGGRVFRGGSWGSVARHLRTALRYDIDPGSGDDDLGFRLARRP